MIKKTKLFGKIEIIHFIGIGGSGMSGIAEILLNLGFKVTGSDIASSETVIHLKKAGAFVFIGHKAANVTQADVVVYSSAIDKKNSEIKKALALKIPIIPRAEMLAQLMRLKRGIAVAGTHGKTSTSSIIGNIFLQAHLKPTTIIGGKVFNIGSNAKLGKGDFVICEADESDGSFLKLSPEIAVVTNIDNDHLDYYGNMKNLKKAFIQFINKIPFYGFAVVCIDSKHVRSILPFLNQKVITYGKSADADFVITNVKSRDITTFDLKFQNQRFSSITINSLGMHNILNSTAGIIVSLELNLKWRTIFKGLESYIGVERRLENVGEVGNIKIIDDYGHHPTEISATLDAVSLRRDYKKLIVVFQPHRYSRTKILYKDFKSVFKKADIVIITKIYPAGEKKIKGVTAELICRAVKPGKNIFYILTRNGIIKKLKEIARSGDLILTLGAGDIKTLGKELLKELK